jgi:hypothetical protein
MKHFFKALKNIKKSPASKLELLDPNPTTLKKLAPDQKTIKDKSNLNLEDYIDDVFKKNPHLSEKEMFEIYHSHKPTFEAEVSKRIQHAKDTEIVSNLSKLRLKHKKNPENINAFHDEYVKEYSKLYKSDK